MIENSYGIVKRLDFVAKSINYHKPKNILDFGCGTGEILTVPLAKNFPDIDFVGLDDDTSSIEFARKKNADVDNLSFLYPDEIDGSPRFDLIIASEVIEHVENPEQLLLFLKDKLEISGRIVITLPNGYGPFEATSLLEALLFLIGIDVGAIYSFFNKGPTTFADSAGTDGKYSLAISPHINFFSYREICSLIKGNGLEISEYQPRSFLCGLGFDQVLRGRFLTSWNNRIADSLPPWIISDWMFSVSHNSKTSESEHKFVVYERNKYARFRKFINKKRWGLTA